MFSESAEGPMPEILTESFCERCGTRYTFESAAPPPQKRLGKIKLLSKGLKNFVLDDDVALDEALAQARTEEERATTSQQLDAFHDAFNFCMSCRQYTCANCWNDIEGRCQTCAPLLGGDFIDEQTVPGKGRNGKVPRRPAKPTVEDMAWPTTDLRRFDGGKTVADPVKGKPAAADKAAANQPDTSAPRPAPHPKPGKAAAAAASGVVAPEAWPELPSLSDRLKKVASAPPKTADEAPTAWPSVDTMLDRPAAASPIADAPVRPAPGQPRPSKPAGGGVPSSFQPGQSIDEALEAYERRRDEAAAEAELSRAKAARDAAAREAAAKEAAAREAAAKEAAAWEAAARDEAARHAAARQAREIAARETAAREAAEREAHETAAREALARQAAERDDVDVEAAELEAAAREALARQAAAREEWEREAAARRTEPRPGSRDSVRRGRLPRSDDRVEVPTWRVVTPETPAMPSREQPPAPSQPIAASHAPHAPLPEEPPKWPTEPQVDTLAFLANRSAEARGMEEVWAASTRDLLGAAGDDTAPGGVQPCVSCGLSLSATARFCRRCGTRQG